MQGFISGILVGAVLCWLLLAGGILAYAVKTLWPFVLSRIHPLYAADTIEREYPS